MLHETKVTKAFNRLHNDYVRFIGPEAIGFYFNLLYINDRAGLNELSVEYISKHTSLKLDRMKIHMKTLRTAKLIKETKGAKGDTIYKLENPGLLSKDDKLQLIHDLLNKNIIEEEDKLRMIEYINKKYGVGYHQEDVPKETKDIDFEDDRDEVNPNSGLSLVEYYYDFLSETFGAKYLSRNARIEARNLKEVMKKNDDSPEQTREFFRWIITKAKQKESFEPVASLGLYPEYRKHAHHALMQAKQKGAKFAPEVDSHEAQSDESILKNIHAVVAIYKNKGMTPEDIENKLRSNFSGQAVDKFLEGKSGN